MLCCVVCMQAQTKVREVLRTQKEEPKDTKKRTAPPGQVTEKRDEPPKKKKKKGGKKEPLVPPDDIFKLENAKNLDAEKAQDSGLDFKVSVAFQNHKLESFSVPGPVLFSFPRCLMKLIVPACPP